MKDDEGRIYHIVRTEDVIRSEKKLGVTEVSASYIKGNPDVLPEDYGFLHPTYQISAIFNDEGKETGFSKIQFNGYPIVWEKITKVKGRRFKKIKVRLNDAEKYFKKSEEDYREYQEEYRRKKAGSRYVVASTTHWKYSKNGVRKSVRQDVSVGRIDGSFYYSPDIPEKKKLVSAKSFNIICEIPYDKQDQARSIVKIINDYDKDLKTLDGMDSTAENLPIRGSDDLEVMLKFHIRGAIHDFTREQREDIENRIERLKDELRELNKEVESGSKE